MEVYDYFTQCIADIPTKKRIFAVAKAEDRREDEDIHHYVFGWHALHVGLCCYAAAHDTFGQD